MRKSSLVTSIAVTIVLSGVSVATPGIALAATSSSSTHTAAQAEAIARKLFSISSDYTVQNQSYGQNPGSQSHPIYTFSFQKPNEAQPTDVVSVSVDAVTGLVLNYNHVMPNVAFKFPVPVSEDQAASIAKAWAKKLYPDQLGQVKMAAQPNQLNDLRSAVQYQFDFERIVNGIPAPFNGFNIVIDQNGGLQSVNDDWSTVTFPSANTGISPTDMNSVYTKALGLHLTYSEIWHTNGKSTVALSYVPAPSAYPNAWNEQFSVSHDVSGIIIDAHSGKLLDASGTAHDVTPYVQPTPLDPKAKPNPLRQTKVNLDQNASLALAQKVFPMDSYTKLTNENESSGANSDTLWNFNFTRKDSKSSVQTTIDVQVDATYGYISNYNSYETSTKPGGMTSQSSKTLSQATLNKLATAAVEKTYSGHLGSLAILPQPAWGSPQPITQFQILSFKNGIQNLVTSGSIGLDPTTGTITSIFMSPYDDTDNTYPSPDKAISQTSANETWVKDAPLQLEYLMTTPAANGKFPTPDSATTAPKVVLAYVPTPQFQANSYFDAIQGQFVPNDGLQSQPYTGMVSDIAGDKNAAQLQLLASRGLIAVDSHGDVHPSGTMTNAAFVKLVMDALGTVNRYNQGMMADQSVASAVNDVAANNPSYKELVTAYALGWLDPNHPLDPNQQVTRSEAARVFSEALNYDALLKRPDLFKLDATDANSINASDFAADAIATGLGMLSLEDNRFNGDQPLTLSDAAQGLVQTASLMGSSPVVLPLK
ncbi:YcdB/YcdC domain-containing protein [Alicyclobacillus dauci]|uniref:SLH domain-containing protein n=1 Tax=Alicyclobacillus dauci TaxID=1475485 RepID=A0ABY6Z4L7_9BACL|nr:YcdB/YcdC domain-containing protein [Alicyclobacillus dauci]WAH37800.1 hypothetical protein NZD86_04655 [Alicyclobacillus dauci]